ncbi:TonB-dependent receptor [Pseudoxanthomonas broegbernensis]|uniref:TonB-dependent receptor n=1 Tax=Pseudoxanthomonas broegbernensis TaxID=83619 RepID=A0A7V8K6U3_9GAMM|nr:TonB-dependent receptor [Pseudoxanthomonas broegbernensis]KAF1686062.1 TonB-dependent receptor [Pseudoxanthomonas broegbernensis]MBB6063678.1 TonB-dependent receptor [Pseudoxanthomonas broegbernensis]
MNHKLKRFKSAAMFTIVGGIIVINPAFAQDQQDATTLDTVVVSGLRSSLDNAMNIKRDTPGIVDAISAEDIGKFPDTNLAESLQRITGISIERRDGEGAQVTARGFGPGFNLVTLNGRQVPGADGFGSGQAVIGGVGAGTRGFNFAQLASEAVNGVTVYKTGRAAQPSGGIGATIDILTARPFNNRGGDVVASAGVKALSDQSQTIGDNITPEISGIFSYANPDKTWGVGLSASYQKRRGGSVQATEDTWNVARWSGTDSRLLPGAVVENAPAIGQLYSMPNDVRYAYQDFQRERINAQGVLQFAPTDALTFTLDYTYSTNEIAQNRGEQTMWLQNNLTHVTFDGHPDVATPVYIRDLAGGGKDFGFEQQRDEQKFTLDSLGLNAKWDVTDRFSLTFDAHNTKVASRPNDPLTGGSSTAFSFGGFAPDPSTNNWTQEYWFNNGLPIMARTLFPTTADAQANTNGVVNPDFTVDQFGSQIMRIWTTRQDTEVKQGRIDGEFAFDNGRFLFGVDSSETKMRRLGVDGHAHLMTLGDWGSNDRGTLQSMGQLLRQVSITDMFKDFSTRGADSNAWIGNASALAQWAENVCADGSAPASWAANNRCDDISSRVRSVYDNDNMVEEKTRSLYVQWEQDGMLGDFPTYLVAGLRYERTDVTSTSVIQVPSAIVWMSNNDFRNQSSPDAQPFSEKASYSYLLPNLDFSIDLTADLKGRASFSKTIARAPYGNLFAGPGAGNPSGSTLYGEQFRATGGAQNPSLLPLESDNVDLGMEWYFAPSSFIGVTYWNKRVKNFIGNTVASENLYGLTDPTSGPDAQAANAFLQSAACAAQVTAAGVDPEIGCKQDYTTLFAATALLRYAAETGGLAAYDGTDAQSLALEDRYDILGTAADPLYMYDVNKPVNQRAATLHGWEIGGQYFFGDSGFGILANYTIVKGDVGIDRAADPGADVFALTGLSDTANAVLMFEKYGWSARLAWNWRDEYLQAANQHGNNRNPFFVEAYDQFDLSVSYNITDNLTVSAEAINITGEDVRWSARTHRQHLRVLDQSPRYMLGLRYTF